MGVYDFKRKMVQDGGGEVDAEDAEEGFGAVNDADIYSDTSSLAALSQVSSKKQGSARNANSIQTRASGKSSRKSGKNRRKHERKMYSTKVGSAYEDIGLVAALHATVVRIYETGPEVGRLSRALLNN